jgi:filamentous hemagglutinin family protein
MSAGKVSLRRTAGIAALAALLASSTHGSVVLDGSLGSAGVLSGPSHAIGANLGRQVGGNLFHSFSSFNLTATESATFSGPTTVVNIIGRVTGGGLSSIDGRIASAIPGANLYFLNPAGIVFGPNAKLDVGGSVLLTTASSLYLGDSGVFSASTDPAASTLASADPSAFGFLGRAAPIELNGTQLSIGAGKSLSLTGGDVLLTDGAGLTARGGNVELGSQEGGSVSLRDSYIWTAGEGVTASGSIRIAGGQITLDRSSLASFNYGGEIAGDITLSASGQLDMSRSVIKSIARDYGNGANITIGVGEVSLSNGSGILSTTDWVGKGGNISIVSQGPIYAGGFDDAGLSGGISASSDGWGNAGNVKLSGRSISLFDGFQVGSNTFGAFGQAGAGGVVQVEAAEDILISGVGRDGYATALVSETLGTGAAGLIDIKGRNLTLQDGGGIGVSSAGMMPGAGEGGSIYVEIAGLLRVTGVHSSGRPSGILGNTYGMGNAGFINLKAASILVGQGGQIGNTSFYTGSGAGKGGYIALRATGALAVSGNAPSGEKSIIFADTVGAGHAGFIDIKAGQVDLREGGQIMSSSHGTLPNSGDGGMISIEAGRLSISGRGANGERQPSGLFSESSGPGWAGYITANVGELEISAGSSIASGSFGGMEEAGSGGYISVAVTGRAVLSGQGASQTGIMSDAAGRGGAGYISLSAGELQLLGGAQINSSSSGTMSGAGAGGFITIDVTGDTLISGVGPQGHPSALVAETIGPGNAGWITLKTGSLRMLDGGSLSSGTYSTAAGAGVGGEIKVQVRGDMLISGVNDSARRTSSITSDSNGPGAAGSIVIEGTRIELSDGGAISSTAYGSESSGGWGKIDIAASEVLRVAGVHVAGESLDRSGIFTNTEGSAYAGDITINSPRLEVVDGGLVASGSLGKMTNARGEGRIWILADEVLVSGIGPDGNRSLISTQTEGPGRAGDITLWSGSVMLRDGAGITSGAYGDMANAGAGGSVTINTGQLSLSGTSSDGQATTINAESAGPGRAGDISINVSGAMRLSDGAEIATRASLADGGNISLWAGEMLKLSHGSITTTVGSGLGNGGNIHIGQPTFVVLNQGLIQANAYGGNGGNIRIVTDHLVASTDSRIEASSELGIDGSVEISTPNVDVGSGLMVLPSNYLDATLLLRDACFSRVGATSSFTGMGRGGLPETPDGLMMSRYDTLLPPSTAARRMQPARLTFACGGRS